MMNEHRHDQLGDFVVVDGLPAVIVGLPDGQGVETPEDHLALWFGTPPVERTSKGGGVHPQPKVWTVPAEYCEACDDPKVMH